MHFLLFLSISGKQCLRGSIYVPENMIQNSYTSFLLTDYSVELWLIARLPFMAQLIKNLSAMQETWVQPLGWEDPLEEDMVIHFGILDWRVPRDRGAWRATVHRVAQSQTRLSN